MPKSVDKLIRQLDEINKKVEILLDEQGMYGDEVTDPLGLAIDALVDLGDELDSQMEEEQDQV